MKLHLAVANALRDHGVDTVFGLMGDVNMLVLASFIDDCGGTFVKAVHEAGAVSMADGYHRMSGRVGVASVTHGPAFTNTLTSVVEAARHGSAMVILTGAPPAIRGHLQDIDIAALALAAGAGYERVWRADSVVNDLAVSFKRAAVEGRPIVVDVPNDLLFDEVDYQRATVTSGPALGAASEDEIDSALGVILSAARPVILAGRGATNSAARSSIIELARLIGAPLATTLMAKDLFAGLPENLGICGSLSSPPALDALVNSDCVIAFGASLSRHTVASGDLFARKRVIQCSGYESPTNQFFIPTMHLAADAALTAKEFVDKIREADMEPRTSMVPRVTDAVEKWDEVRQSWPDRSSGNTVDLTMALRRINDLLPTDRVVVTDAGRFTLTAWHEVAATSPGGFTHTASFGSIGLGLATAIGASFARPTDVTVCLVGDGGFMMAAVHLWTAAHYRRKLVVVLANDGSYGAEYDKLNSYGVDPDHSLMEWSDIAAVARGYGIETMSVRSQADLAGLEQRLGGLDGPLLVDLHIDPALTAEYDGTPK